MRTIRLLILIIAVFDARIVHAQAPPLPVSAVVSSARDAAVELETHSVRLLVGPGHRVLLPLSALVGGIFLVWADTAARTLFDPRELPVGIVTALIGAPVFALLLARRRSAT